MGKNLVLYVLFFILLMVVIRFVGFWILMCYVFLLNVFVWFRIVIDCIYILLKCFVGLIFVFEIKFRLG